MKLSSGAGQEINEYMKMLGFFFICSLLIKFQKWHFHNDALKNNNWPTIQVYALEWNMLIMVC